MLKRTTGTCLMLLAALLLSSPSARATMTWHGGDVLHNPRIDIAYWGWSGGDPAGEKPRLVEILSGLAGSRYLNTVTQYYDNTGYAWLSTGLGINTWDDPDPLPANWASSVLINTGPTPGNQVETEVENIVNHFGFDPNTIYIMATGTTRYWNSSYYGGTSYHGYTSKTYANGKSAVFIDYPYQPSLGSCGGGGLAAVDCLAFHELVEAIENPRGAGWWDNVTGYEGVDLCNLWRGVPLADNSLSSPSGPYTIPDSWSNFDGGCVAGDLWSSQLYYRVSSSIAFQEISNAFGANHHKYNQVGAFSPTQGETFASAPAATFGGPTANPDDAQWEYWAVLGTDGKIHEGMNFWGYNNIVPWDFGGIWTPPSDWRFLDSPTIDFEGGYDLNLFVTADYCVGGLCEIYNDNLWREDEWSGTGWSDWGAPPSGDSAMSSPAAVTWANDEETVFVISGGNLWQAKTIDGGANITWTQWSTSGNLTGNPGAAVQDEPTTSGGEIVNMVSGTSQAVALDTSGNILWFTAPGTSRNLSHPSGVTLQAGPAISTWGADGNVSVAASGINGTVYGLIAYNYADVTGWNPTNGYVNDGDRITMISTPR